MLRSFRAASLLLLGLPLLPAVACTITTGPADSNDAGFDSSTSPDSEPPDADRDAGDDLGECTPYTPAAISGRKAGSFASRDDVVTITLPKTDIGGGLLKVTYVAADVPFTPSIWLLEGDKSGEARTNLGPIGAPVTSTPNGVVHYRLQGNRTYELRTTPFTFDEGGPNTYAIDYAYEALPDCYEGNDTRAEAKRIPLNKRLTAYQHAGIGPSDSLFVRDSGVDWYTFELTEPKTVKLKATLPGKDGADGENAAFLSVLLADGITTPSCTGSGSFATDPVSPVEEVETCDGRLPAGKYFVKLDLFTSQPASSDINEPARKPWNTPYTFVVEAK